jgi:hypothetical protein
MEYQRFASALAFAKASPPTTTLSSDARQVTYKDKTIHLDDWIAGLRGAYNNCISLVKVLCRGKDFSIELPDNFVDNMTDTRYGYSWVDSFKGVDSEPLMKHLMSNTSGDSPCKVGVDQTLIWNSAWQLSWMRTAGELDQEIANLHHTVPGQPCRIAELCDFRLRNGLRGRNIFYNHGNLWLIVRRVKPETLTQHEEFIPVKLPPELCQLYKIYLLIIRPVEINFARRLWGKQAASLYHEYLYVINGQRLLESQFYLQFKRWTELRFKCSIGVRGYRQSVVVVARAYLGTEYELELEEEDDALIKQRGHGALADRRCYGVQSSYLTTLSSDLMFRFGHMSEWWWRLTQFAPGKAPLLPLDIRRKQQSSDIYIPLHSSDHSTATQAVQPVPAAHLDENRLAAIISASVGSAIRSLKNDMEEIIQSRVAAGIAEVLSRQGSLRIPVSQQPSITLSATDTSMDIDLSTVAEPPTGTQLAPQLTPLSSSNTLVSDPMDIDLAPHSKTALHYLKQLYKDIAEPKFRSKGQQRMVELALAGTQNFIGILPTGGGKSLIFLLPAFAATVDTAPDGTVMKTLVIIPNKSLLTETLDKALKFNISCAQWTANISDRVIKDTALILLAIESLACYKFKWYGFNQM